ncbi:Fur family transcriptional regulator [Paramagnetospirillum kuznetsovii]|uniref:Ferric uptake regulation protein n=2 Tax=Paramagnetospirillum kuznetsovii TaxID=2053833 RepID=A0A364NW58_9PROT|nr:Fur family transcriptional regulator [Paramagnetospirillum kuznetsovii]RAU21157.1 Fur family transcriptional regulator [Paramagnetospirillum kuznetsovii]
MSFPVPQHDHGACIRGAMDAAESACRMQGARLTPIRRRVLELVWENHQPVGAYALLETLAKEGWSAAPPTVYRALDFLLRHGLVHRIALQNAFVGCSHPGEPHAGAFLLCSHCGAAAELADLSVDRAIAEAAARNGFSVTRQTIEVEGLCPACRAGGAGR